MCEGIDEVWLFKVFVFVDGLGVLVYVNEVLCDVLLFMLG